jgi:hypothetical protein
LREEEIVPVPVRPHDDGVSAVHRALIERALERASTPEARERAIVDLLELAGARIEPLEAVRAELHRRLTRRNPDVETSEALRLVDGALVQAARPDGPWGSTTGRRARRRRRR